MEEPTGITETINTVPTGALYRGLIEIARRERALSMVQAQIHDLERNYETMRAGTVRLRGRRMTQEGQQQAMEDILEELRDLGAIQMEIIDEMERYRTNIDRYGDTMTERDLMR